MTSTARKYNVLNILMSFHAFPDEVQGKYCLVECIVPVGAGAPPNHHAGETEAFYILDGEVAFLIDGKERLARSGDFVPIPDGAVHAFKAVGAAPARLLILNAPGRMHQQFFTSIGEALPEDFIGLPAPKEPDLPAILASAAAAGMTILPPN
ncbi:cupin domain-containing protein [Paracoccus sp. PS-1]|uniref:cupin domain-containing protein n=1 Tax=unclassified Paracoccus (in: a-proteobacteria) TaxID=2688777 RepID=UPI00048C8BF4|nr:MULTISPECIES: cupin domain-containing protein [unclassified Paracoccus (in: a-proteobacteria)]MDQ7261907.1 cupin domain-containing protein [Paracoccus sp. PS1]RQP05882.1 MAG: cupin domain-containing protein [Paracoccus sp. BP8]